MTKKFKTEVKEWIKESMKELEKESKQWKNIIGDVVWVHLEIENAMLSTIIDLQDIYLGSKERKEVEELNFLGAAKTCFLMGYIDDELYEEIKGFNTTRNNIVHKIFKKPEKTEDPILIKKTLLKGKEIARKIYDAHFSLEEEMKIKGK